MAFLEQTIGRIYPQDAAARDAAQAALAVLAPLSSGLTAADAGWALTLQLAGIQRQAEPNLQSPVLVVLAADHGIAGNNLSAGTSASAAAMRRLAAGKSPAACLALASGVTVVPVDMGLQTAVPAFDGDKPVLTRTIGPGTRNIATGPAMSPALARQAVETGMQLAEQLVGQHDLVAISCCGEGQLAACAAIASCCTGENIAVFLDGEADCTQRGAVRNADLLAAVQRTQQIDRKNGLELLAQLGGYELGGAAGLILGAASHRLPVLLEGFAAVTAALIASAMEAFIRDFVMVSHDDGHPGFLLAMRQLGLSEPLLACSVPEDPGAGALLALPVVLATAKIPGLIGQQKKTGQNRSLPSTLP